jgi:hypothetical protein
MKFWILSCLMITMFSLTASAESRVDSIVHQYYRQTTKQVVPPNCRPQTSCFQVACDKLSKFECDEISEQNQIRNACRNVWGGECIEQSTQLLGQFEYDDLEEMVQLVQSCRGVFDLNCVKYSCDRLGRFGCDDLEEIAQVNQSCANSYPFYH